MESLNGRLRELQKQMMNTPSGPARDALQDEYTDLDAEIDTKAASTKAASIRKTRLSRKRRELAGEMFDDPWGEENQETAIMLCVPKADETLEGEVDGMVTRLAQAAKGKAGWRRMKQTVEVALAPSPPECPTSPSPEEVAATFLRSAEVIFGEEGKEQWIKAAEEYKKMKAARQQQEQEFLSPEEWSKAVLQVQAGINAAQTRRGQNDLLTQEQTASAQSIQAAMRSRSERGEAMERSLLLEDEAALRVQALFHGRWTKKQVAADRLRNVHGAAARLQGAMRARQATQEVMSCEVETEDDAAQVIHGFLQGRQARLAVSVGVNRGQARSASRIQGLVKGRTARDGVVQRLVLAFLSEAPVWVQRRLSAVRGDCPELPEEGPQQEREKQEEEEDDDDEALDEALEFLADVVTEAAPSSAMEEVASAKEEWVDAFQRISEALHERSTTAVRVRTFAALRGSWEAAVAVAKRERAMHARRSASGRGRG